MRAKSCAIFVMTSCMIDIKNFTREKFLKLEAAPYLAFLFLGAAPYLPFFYLIQYLSPTFRNETAPYHVVLKVAKIIWMD